MRARQGRAGEGRNGRAGGRDEMDIIYEPAISRWRGVIHSFTTHSLTHPPTYTLSLHTHYHTTHHSLPPTPLTTHSCSPGVGDRARRSMRRGPASRTRARAVHTVTAVTAVTTPSGGMSLRRQCCRGVEGVGEERGGGGVTWGGAGGVTATTPTTTTATTATATGDATTAAAGSQG